MWTTDFLILGVFQLLTAVPTNHPEVVTSSNRSLYVDWAQLGGGSLHGEAEVTPVASRSLELGWGWNSQDVLSSAKSLYAWPQWCWPNLTAQRLAFWWEFFKRTTAYQASAYTMLCSGRAQSHWGRGLNDSVTTMMPHALRSLVWNSTTWSHRPSEAPRHLEFWHLKLE